MLNDDRSLLERGGRSTTARWSGWPIVVLLAAVVVGLGGAAPALAVNGQSPQTVGLFSAAPGPGGDFVVACTPNGTCETAQNVFLRGFSDDDVRIFRGGEVLSRDTAVRATTFGSITGLGPGFDDVVCWTFKRRPGGGPAGTVSADYKACTRIVAGTCSGGACRPNCDRYINNRQNNAVCEGVRAQLTALGAPALAYVLAVDTSKTGDPSSVTVTTCSGYVAQCADAGSLATGIVDIKANRGLATVNPSLGGGLYCSKCK
jgi:hypothetical protein